MAISAHNGNDVKTEAWPELSELHVLDSYPRRHLGPSADAINDMLAEIGVASVDELIGLTVADAIRMTGALNLPAAEGESSVLMDLREMAEKNTLFRSFIGMGYYDCVTPPVIQRNILENPAWYTHYTPYQPEIAQGRSGGAAQLSDDGGRSDRSRHCQCVSPG